MIGNYENMRRVSYHGGAVFVPVCETCGRFVKANDIVRINEETGLHPEPNATCSKCGPCRMLFEGFV